MLGNNYNTCDREDRRLSVDRPCGSSESSWTPPISGESPAIENFKQSSSLVSLGVHEEMRESEKIWLACAIETEGSVGYIKPKKKYGTYCYPYIQFVNTDIALVQRVSETFGSKIYLDGRPRKKPLYRTYIYNKKAIELLHLLQPYFVGQKQKIVNEILEAYPN